MVRKGFPKFIRLFDILVIGVSLVSLSACQNGGMFKSKKVSGVTRIHASTQVENQITVDGAVLSNVDPSRYVEIYSSGGVIENYCGGLNCDCVFEYFVPQIGDHSITSRVEYVEANMARCSKTELQYNPTVATLKLKHRPTGALSQPILLDLNTGSSNLDASIVDSYIEGVRTDCQEKIHVPNVLDPKDEGGGSGIYDAVQSEDGRLAFRLNFYMGNAGEAIRKFAESFQMVAPSEIARYQCTTRGRDADMRLFSLDSDAPNVNSREIYPFKKENGQPQDTFNRNQFYMLKSPNNAFRSPIIARPAPNYNPTAIGYGVPVAYLDPSQSQEVCPDQETQYYTVYPYAPRVTVPTGWKWVKLWQFRLVMPNNTRSPKMSNKMVGTGNVLGAVTCKGTADVGGGAGSINRDCTNLSRQVDGDPTKLADRILGYTDTGTGNLVGAACVHITRHILDGNGSYTFSNDGFGPAGATTDPNTRLQKNLFDFNRFAPGTDVWHRRGGSTGLTYDNSCTAANPYDPLRICERVEYGGNPPSTVQRGVPYDPAPVSMNETRFKRQDPSLEDYVLVASPTSVMTGDMQGRSGRARAYIPYRYIPASLCPNVNNEAQDCAAYSGYKYTYDVLLKDLNAKDEPGALNSFPMCVLQKDGG